MANYHISIIVEPAYATLISPADLEAQAKKILAEEGAQAGAGLGIVITDDATVQNLNRRFRGMDESTDVLSFESGDDAGFGTPSGTRTQLGEVVISLPMAKRQAKAGGEEVRQELLHLLTHGILHVLGYDHESAEQEREMHRREEALLDGWRH